MTETTPNENIAVVYYSHTGNNKYLASNIAEALHCDLIPIISKRTSMPILIFQSWLGIGGIQAIKEPIGNYDKVVLCGPIWTGLLIAPLRSFIKRYEKDIKKLVFVTCCGSKDEEKHNRFGYARIFDKVRNLLGEKNVLCEAFPIILVIPEDKLKDDNYLMEARLSDDNFTGAIRQRFDGIIEKVKSV
jgi:flavodoxin